MNKIKKGDDVLVLTGKDKGKQGVVSLLVGDDRVLVQGVNKLRNIKSRIHKKILKAALLKNQCLYTFLMWPCITKRLRRLIRSVLKRLRTALKCVSLNPTMKLLTHKFRTIDYGTLRNSI